MGLFKAVIFDVDGTLVDSNRAHVRAWIEAFRAVGVEVDQARLRALLGLHPEQLARKALQGTCHHYSEVFQVTELHDHFYLEKEASAIHPMPGTYQLVSKLAAAGIPIEISSGASRTQIETVMSRAGISAFFKVADAVTGATISSNTESLELALARLGLQPTECLFIGSSPYDIEAASRLKMASIALRSGGWQTAALRNARSIYDDLDDLWFRFNSSILRETYLVFMNLRRAQRRPSPVPKVPEKNIFFGAVNSVS